MSNADYFLEKLYPLQDRVFALLRQVETGLYLTGGTAASLIYLQMMTGALDYGPNG